MNLFIKGIEFVEEIRPAIFKIVLTVEQDEPVSLIVNDLTLRQLMAQMVTHTLA